MYQPTLSCELYQQVLFCAHMYLFGDTSMITTA